jgi:hypothetical protein
VCAASPAHEKEVRSASSHPSVEHRRSSTLRRAPLPQLRVPPIEHRSRVAIGSLPFTALQFTARHRTSMRFIASLRFIAFPGCSSRADRGARRTPPSMHPCPDSLAVRQAVAALPLAVACDNRAAAARFASRPAIAR